MENVSGYIEDVFEHLKEINQYYKISDMETEDYLKTANKAYVLIAGKEGSDKGGFCNDLFLGYRRNILEEKNISGEDITTIIEYGDEDSVEVYRGNIKERYTLDEYTKTDTTREYIRVYLNNTKLCEFENLSLVEVAGIENISEVYNKLSEYTHKKYHYCLIVLPADDMDMDQNTIDKISEIENKGAKVCLVITKCDERDTKEIDEYTEKLKDAFNEPVNIVLSGNHDGDYEKIVNLIKDNYKNIRYRNSADYYKYTAEKTISHLNRIVNTFEANYSLIDENQKKLSNYLDEVIKEKNNSDLIRECDKCMDQMKKELIKYFNEKEDYFITYIYHKNNYNELPIPLYLDIANIIYNNLSVLLKKYVDVLRNIDNIGAAIELAIFSNIDNTFEKLDLKSKINSILEIPVLMGAIFSGFGYVYMKAREKERKEKIKVKLEKEIFYNIAEEIRVNVKEKIVNENIIKGAEKIIDEKIKSIKENINQLEKIKGSEEEYKNKKTEELKENIKALEENIKKLN